MLLAARIASSRPPSRISVPYVRVVTPPTRFFGRQNKSLRAKGKSPLQYFRQVWNLGRSGPAMPSGRDARRELSLARFLWGSIRARGRNPTLSHRQRVGLRVLLARWACDVLGGTRSAGSV